MDSRPVIVHEEEVGLLSTIHEQLVSRCSPILLAQSWDRALKHAIQHPTAVVLTRSARFATMISRRFRKVSIVMYGVPLKIGQVADDVYELAVEDPAATSEDRPPEQIIGSSPQMVELRAQVATLAATRACVVLLGETGVGKGLVARAIHGAGPKRKAPFQQINCAAIPAELLEAELFGYLRGSFTGALAGKAGLIEAAEDGTAFLDEIGELPIALQPKLLDVLDTMRVRRIGQVVNRRVHARIITATNKDLGQMIKRRAFRPDLYYRINVMQIRVPPLREHRSDIPELGAFMLNELAKSYDAEHILSPGAERSLMAKHLRWPGNVRELHHVLERAVAAKPKHREISNVEIRAVMG